jgi:hypothetical protein
MQPETPKPSNAENLATLIAKRHDLFLDYTITLEAVLSEIQKLFEREDCSKIAELTMNATETVGKFQGLFVEQNNIVNSMQQLSDCTSHASKLMNGFNKEIQTFNLSDSKFYGYENLAKMQKLKAQFEETLPSITPPLSRIR